MVHDLYCIQALMNRAEPTAFSAQIGRQSSDAPADLAMAQLKWGDETVAALTASFLTPRGMGLHGYDRMEVLGGDWAARLTPNPRPIQLWDTGSHYPLGIEIRPDPSCPSGMLAEELRAFCRVVRGVEPVPLGATYEDAIQVQRWIEILENASTRTQADRC
jgi:predicted dehydrogenase